MPLTTLTETELQLLFMRPDRMEIMKINIYIFPIFVCSALALAGAIHSAQASSFCSSSGRQLAQGCGNSDLFTATAGSSAPASAIALEGCHKYKNMRVWGVSLSTTIAKKLTAECEARNARKIEGPDLSLSAF
jgi:hypothetical protein